MNNHYAKFAAAYKEEYLKTLKTLISIPSPSYKEKEIACMIKDFLEREAEAHACPDVPIIMDDIGNVYCEIGGDLKQGDGCMAFCAHTDTVFPDFGTEIPFREEDGRLYGLGAKDNCANVCALMFCIKYIFENHITPVENLLFIFDVCEEGLGNLRGSRRIFEKYPAIKQFIAFDLDYGTVFDRAVGSERYEVRVSVQGGHAFRDFGNKNAIQIMSEIIQEFYHIDTAELEGKTTYNVGTIEGGTSVNAIAQECTALFEWRSDSEKSGNHIRQIFDTILEREEKKCEGKAVLKKTRIGLRPSMGVFTDENRKLHSGMTARIAGIIKDVAGITPSLSPGSTDCNIPLSKGIPAVCTGTCLGQGEHTREEYVEISSLEKGLIIALETVLGDLY